MIDDISFLVDETFKVFDDKKIEEDIYEGPGLIYKLEKTPLMFVVRALAYKNVHQAMLELEENPEQFPELRIENISEAKIFKTDDFTLAQIARDAISNRRFPLYEETFLNISDPSMSWWLSVEDDSIEISFRMIHTNHLEKMIKLGPLGDSDLALKTFIKLKNYFGLYFPVHEFSFTESSVAVRSEKNDKMFQLFKELFLTGEPKIDLINQMYNQESQFNDHKKEFIKFANFYLLELATTRRFWLEIIKDLD